MTYRIKKWDILYENNRTRTLKNMQWVPIPNQFDGDGYTQLMDEPDGMALYGSWVLLLAVASKCHPRGTLVRSNGKPHTVDSLARLTRGNSECFSRAIQLFIKIGWIEEISEETAKPQEGAVITQEGAGSAQCGADITALNGMERMEGNGKKEYLSGSAEMNLVEFFVGELVRINPGFKKPNVQAWAKEFDFIMRLDKRTDTEIRKMIASVVAHPFWHKNILSPSKLRLQFDRLTLEFKNGRNQGNAGGSPEQSQRAERKYAGVGA